MGYKNNLKDDMQCIDLIAKLLSQNHAKRNIVALSHHFDLLDSELIDICKKHDDNHENKLCLTKEDIIEIDNRLNEFLTCDRLCEKLKLYNICKNCKNNDDYTDNIIDTQIEKKSLLYVVQHCYERKVIKALHSKADIIFKSLHKVSKDNKEELYPLFRLLANFLIMNPLQVNDNMECQLFLESFLFTHEYLNTDDVTNYILELFNEAQVEFTEKEEKEILSYLTRPDDYLKKKNYQNNKNNKEKVEKVHSNIKEKAEDKLSKDNKQKDEKIKEIREQNSDNMDSEVISFSSMYTVKEDLPSNVENSSNSKSSTTTVTIDKNASYENSKKETNSPRQPVDMKQESNLQTKEKQRRTDKPLDKNYYSIFNDAHYFENKISIISNPSIITVTSKEEIVTFDIDMLKNRTIAIEYVINENNQEGLLLYLNESNLYYFIHLEDRDCQVIAKYYLENRNTVRKITFFSAPVVYYCYKNGISIVNISSLSEYISYNYDTDNSLVEQIDKLVKKKYPYDRPFILFIIKYYDKLLNTVESQINIQEKQSILKREKIKCFLSRSYMISDISSYQEVYLLQNQKQILFNSCAEIKGNGKNIKIQIKNDKAKKETDVYIEAIWTLIISGAMERYKPRIIQLSTQDGIVFVLNSSAYRNFITILQRVLLQAFKRVESKKPNLTVNVEIF